MGYRIIRRQELPDARALLSHPENGRSEEHEPGSGFDQVGEVGKEHRRHVNEIGHRQRGQADDQHERNEGKKVRADVVPAHDHQRGDQQGEIDRELEQAVDKQLSEQPRQCEVVMNGEFEFLLDDVGAAGDRSLDELPEDEAGQHVQIEIGQWHGIRRSENQRQHCREHQRRDRNPEKSEPGAVVIGFRLQIADVHEAHEGR